MSTITRAFALAALACLAHTPAYAQDASTDDMRSLDGQVQEIKSDVLSIAAELNNLEERLLYPSGTRCSWRWPMTPHSGSTR